MAESEAGNAGRRSAVERAELVSRREALGGGLMLAAMFLAGCRGQGSSADLPNPNWPSDDPEIRRPITVAPGTAPAPAPKQPTTPPSIPTGVVSRSQWTRSGPMRGREINPMNGITRITVHHDAVNSSGLRSYADVARRLENTRSGHLGRGWADIGYHYIIDPTGRVWEGRSLAYQGAHVQDNNEHNLGIMLLGNFDQQSPSSQQQAALERFVAQQMSLYRVPLRRVYTHQEIKSTACPGRSLQRFMVSTRSRGNLSRYA